MATFNIASAKNIDELATKAGSDTYNILNGGYLTVDQDSRYGTNNNTSAAMGNITMAAGGVCTVEFTATKVRLIPYDTGTGTVPNSNTNIVQGSATGKLIGVYDTLTSAPTAAGAAMPADGYIKIKQWNDVAYAAGALTNIGANATGPDVVGWIEVVGVDALDCTVNRLNTFKVRGEWYDLGAISGSSRTTTYQIPTNGSTALYLPGVWVETASSGVYEFYPRAGAVSALAASVATDAVRGKMCWISLSGVLRFGSDGTNSTGGYLPPDGRKIRIPNIFFVNCTSAGPTVNSVPHATLTTRYSFLTTGGGVIDMDKCLMDWWATFAQPYSVTLSNVGFATQLVVSEVASPIAWSQVGVGATAADIFPALSMATCLAGGTITDCRWWHGAAAVSGNYYSSLTDISGFTFSNNYISSIVTKGHATTGSGVWTRVANTTFNDCTFGCGRVFMTTCSNLTFNDTIYYDNPATSTIVGSFAHYLFDMGTACSNIVMDGVTFGSLTLAQPASGILNVGATACTNIKLRNLGTYASPLDMGGAQQDGVAYSRTTTTATVTKTAHGLKTGDIIYVLASDSVAAIVVGSKTLASAPTADTFTFACLNAGAASGVITYYPTMAGQLFAVASAASNVEVKRCYTPHLRTNLYTSDNSVKNLVIKNVMGDYINAPLATAGPALDLTYQGIHSTPAQTAQVSDYGTIWFDGFIQETTSPAAGRAWTRSSTTATVTDATDHNLRTGMQIVVTVTSNAACIILGTKTVTVLTKDSFTFTCIASGTTGTLTYVPLTGRIGLMMNEKTAQTTAHYTTTGTPSFTSAGTLFFPAAGDKVVWETPDYIIGHTGFPALEPVLNATTSAKKNLNVLYYIDKNDGNGYSSAKNLSYIRAGGGGSNGSTDVTMTDTTGVAVNDYIFGTNIAPLAKVQSITNGTTIVSTIANIGTVSGVLLFNQLPNETVNAQNGFKLKISMEAKKGTAAATWTRSTTTATCTYNDHGLSVGDVFAVTISSDEAAITVAAKAVAAVTNENVFTFTCLNAGAGSGTLTYTYPVITSYHIMTDSSETSRAYQYVLDPVTVSQYVKNSTGTAIQSARVLLLADSGGSLPSEATVTISRASSTASVSHTGHGMSLGQQIQIKGANEKEYNGVYTISNVTTNAYDYTVSGTPATPATGTIKSTAVVLTGTTDVNGLLTGTFAYSGAAQPIKGRARKSSAAPYYQTNAITGSVTSTGYAGTVYLVADA